MRLFVVLNLLLLLTFGWSSYQVGLIKTEMSDATGKYNRCRQTAETINHLRSQTAQRGIASSQYDCAREMSRLFQTQGIDGLSAISSRVVAKDDSNFVTKSVANPMTQPISLPKLLKLFRSLDSHEPGFFVDSVLLTRPSSTALANEPELWEVSELEIGFVATKAP